MIQIYIFKILKLWCSFKKQEFSDDVSWTENTDVLKLFQAVFCLCDDNSVRILRKGMHVC
jgi:hypothetical protein